MVKGVTPTGDPRRPEASSLIVPPSPRVSCAATQGERAAAEVECCDAVDRRGGGPQQRARPRIGLIVQWQRAVLHVGAAADLFCRPG